MDKTFWKSAARHLFMYAFDMCIAIGGWTWGFGLHVKNWWALIGLLIISRFVWHTFHFAYWRRDILRERSSASMKSGNEL